MTQAYPLHWPPGWPRTDRSRRTSSRFKTGDRFGSITRATISEVHLLGGRSTVISTNLPLRQDGMPYASWAAGKQPDDPGVAVYFTLRNRQQCIPCDRWTRVADNLHAIELTISALRGIERWGAKEMMDAAFRGFVALPAPVGVVLRPWRSVLRLDGFEFEYFDQIGLPAVTISDAEAAYRSLAKDAHADTGGSHERMVELNEAIRQAREELE